MSSKHNEDQYLIINKKILPEYYQQVIDARNMINLGLAKSVSEAVEKVGISRSTYYKFKDYIFSPSENSAGKRAVLSLILSHERGVLSALLNCMAGFHANILTITQSIPIHGQASVMISLDLGEVDISMDEMITSIERVRGVHAVRLIALE